MSRQPSKQAWTRNSPDTGYTHLDEPQTATQSGVSGPPRLSPTMPKGPTRQWSNGSGRDAPWGGSDSGSGTSSVDQRGSPAVAAGTVGGNYGPYSYERVGALPTSRPIRDSSLPASPSNSTFPVIPTRYSPRTSSTPSPFAPTISTSPSHSSSRIASPLKRSGKPMTDLVWTAKDEAKDELLHNLTHDRKNRASFSPFSARGWLNASALFIMVAGLVALFAGYPILDFYTRTRIPTYGAYNVGGVNSTGQIPYIPGLPTLIDVDTPASALTRTGFDGQKYNLAFSDEFNTDGRTFWPGDDPFWEAEDLHYWATQDLEWYDPDAATTKDGALVITLSQEPIHDLNFRSAMVTSWNKFCFTGGYVEVSIRLPGSDKISGLWPGAWTLGNLARAGHGATTDGTWPYSYSTCDLGTLKNQTNVAGTGPQAAFTSAPTTYGGTGILSYQPGQRLSACSCPGSDHPGPNVGVGRGAPEIDILEAEIYEKKNVRNGAVSQSAQFAPFNAGYQYVNTTPATKLYQITTSENGYLGGVYQQAVSAVSFTDTQAYELTGQQFSTYGFEFYPDPEKGYLTWQVAGKPTWQITSATVGPDPESEVGQRLIAAEPMYLIFNLGMASSFAFIDYAQLTFPAKMSIDYVRVYQREDSPNVGCDPVTMPTADYIQNHLNAYTNKNLTTWDAAGYTFPSNSLTGC